MTMVVASLGLWAKAVLSGAQSVVETGVGYRWSSLVILAGFADWPNCV